MGVSGISFSELMLILVVVLLLFGSKRLPGIATDLGAAIRNFRRAITTGESDVADTRGSEERPPQEGTPK